MNVNRRSARWIAPIALGVMAVGGIAYATIPDGNGVIHGCYKKSGGTLRVIDASVTNCDKTETALTWGQSGPPGAPGTPGVDGADGASLDFTGTFGVRDDVEIPSRDVGTATVSCPPNHLFQRGSIINVYTPLLQVEADGVTFDSATLTCKWSVRSYNGDVSAHCPGLLAYCVPVR